MKTLAIALCIAVAVCGCSTVQDIINDLQTNSVPVIPAITNVVPPAVVLPVVTNAPAAQPSAMLPKPAAICAPDKGVECPTPFGKDIRAIAADGKGKFLCFVGCDAWAKSLTFDGTTVTAAPSWTRNGVTYVCYGVRVPKSGGPLIEALSARYRKTTRFYYWPTREAVP